MQKKEIFSWVVEKLCGVMFAEVLSLKTLSEWWAKLPLQTSISKDFIAIIDVSGALKLCGMNIAT